MISHNHPNQNLVNLGSFLQLTFEKNALSIIAFKMLCLSLILFVGVPEVDRVTFCWSRENDILLIILEETKLHPTCDPFLLLEVKLDFILGDEFNPSRGEEISLISRLRLQFLQRSVTVSRLNSILCQRSNCFNSDLIVGG